MKALLMKRTSIVALACALAVAAVVGIGVAQANAADVEAADNVAVEERIDGEATDDGVYLEVDDQAQEAENAATEVPADEADGAVAEDIPADAVEKADAEAEANVAVAEEDEYIEAEERDAEDLDEDIVNAAAYIDEDEPAENIVEVRGE